MRLPPLVVSDTDQAELQRLARSHTTPQRDVIRARIVLLAARGHTNRAIAELVGLHQNQVGIWRQRYAAGGLAGLAEPKRPGRPLVYGHDALDAVYRDKYRRYSTATLDRITSPQARSTTIQLLPRSTAS